MSDIHITTVGISGPNAAAADKAARKQKALDDNTWAINERGGHHLTGLTFYGRWSGDAVVEYVKKLSSTFTTETFELSVNGPAGCWDTYQGDMTIQNGKSVSDSPCEQQEGSYEELHSRDRSDRPDPQRLGELLWKKEVQQ